MRKTWLPAHPGYPLAGRGLAADASAFRSTTTAPENVDLDVLAGGDLNPEFRAQVDHVAAGRLHLEPAGLRAEDFGGHLARLEAEGDGRGQLDAGRALQDDLHAAVEADLNDARASSNCWPEANRSPS